MTVPQLRTVCQPMYSATFCNDDLVNIQHLANVCLIILTRIRIIVVCSRVQGVLSKREYVEVELR